MWRDRTNLYISYRQSYAHHPAKKTRFSAPSAASNGTPYADDERRGLMSAGAFEDDGDAVIEMDLLPPRWLDIQDEVAEKLGDIAAKTRQLDQLHQKHVLPGFDDEDVKKKEERDIERLTQDITRAFHGCQTAIKRIDTMVREQQQSGTITGAEETMARNLKVSLATRVGEVSALFRKKQAAYLKKLRSIGGFASPMPGSSTPTPQNPYTEPALLDTTTDESLAQSTLQQTQVRRQQKLITTGNEAVIAQREREIEDIAQGIIELAGIFQELQTMVIDQGTMLDRIDYNVERMGTEVKAAEKELKVATSYQRRSVKRKIMLLLLLLVVGMFIILGLKLGSRGSDGGGGAAAPAPAPALPPETPQGDEAPPPLPEAPPSDGTGVAGGARLRRASPHLGETYLIHRKDWRRRRRRRRGETLEYVW